MRMSPTSTPPWPGLFAALIQAALLLSATLSAQPLLLIDTTFVHGEQADTRPEASLPLRATVPADWDTPIALASGTAHFRLEILAKPTGVAIRYQPCMERGAVRACAPGRILSDSGAADTVHTWSHGLPQWTPSGMDWSRRPDRFVLIVQDAYGNPIIPQTPGGPAPIWVGQPFASLYYPMAVRFSAALMPQGAAFPGWDGFIPTAASPARYARRGGPESRLILIGGRGKATGVGVRGAGVSAGRGPDAIWDIRGRWVPDRVD